MLTLQELFEFEVMQTDPNFANYRYQPDSQKIVLFDFGATREISPKVIEQYRQLIHAGLANNDTAPMAVANDIGFVTTEVSAAHRGQILRMMRLVFATLATKQLQTDGLAQIVDGFVPQPLPIDVLLLHRKFAGIF